MLLDTQLTSVRDKQRLIPVVDRALSSWLTYAPYLEYFRIKLRRSRAVAPAHVPADVITMNSRFALEDAQSGETSDYTLVFPEEKAEAQGRLSILSLMGTALFGARVGEQVYWMSPLGAKLATVKELFYQPEAAGHHHL